MTVGVRGVIEERVGGVWSGVEDMGGAMVLNWKEQGARWKVRGSVL